jgi:hypothetical protein
VIDQVDTTPDALTQEASSPLTSDFIQHLAQYHCGDIISSSDCDVADGPLPCFEAAPVSPDVTGNAIASDKRGRAIVKKIMRPFFRTQERHGASRPKRASVKPFARTVARSRATHSHTSHGGARKAGDDGDGDGDGPAAFRSACRSAAQSAEALQ